MASNTEDIKDKVKSIKAAAAAITALDEEQLCTILANSKLDKNAPPAKPPSKPSSQPIPIPKTFECEICKKLFTTMFGLNIHKGKMHKPKVTISVPLEVLCKYVKDTDSD